MQFHIRTVVTWENSGNETEPFGQCRIENHLIRAVSRKAAINKALRQAYTMPCYRDRDNADIPVEAEVVILGECDGSSTCCK